MSKLPTSRRPQRPGRYLLLAAATLLSSLDRPEAWGQSSSATVGYASVADFVQQLDGYYHFPTPTSSSLVFIPFAFDTLGDYTLSSVKLLLDDGINQGDDSNHAGGTDGDGGGAPGGDGGFLASVSVVSVKVYSSLPESLTLPEALLAFSPGEGTTTIGTVPLSYNFLANSAPTFTAGQTYYLAIANPTGNSSWAWLATGNDSTGVPYLDDDPITTLVSNGTELVYHHLTSGGLTHHYENLGGFSITATSVSAVPEPTTVSALAGAAVLAVALFVRGRRRQSTVANDDSRTTG